MSDNFSALIVEPDSDIQNSIAELLTSNFLIDEIFTAPSSHDALNILTKNENLHCIIIDTNLLDSPGYALATDIKSIDRHSKTPILLLSDFKDREHLMKAAACGATDIISKPFSITNLNLKLKKLIRHKRHRTSDRLSTMEAFPIQIEFESGSHYQAKLVDISSGGCSVKSERFTQGGGVYDKTTLKISFDSEELSVDAEVIRIERDPESHDDDSESNKLIVGFQFANPEDKSLEKLKNHVQSNSNAESTE